MILLFFLGRITFFSIKMYTLPTFGFNMWHWIAVSASVDVLIVRCCLPKAGLMKKIWNMKSV